MDQHINRRDFMKLGLASTLALGPRLLLPGNTSAATSHTRAPAALSATSDVPTYARTLRSQIEAEMRHLRIPGAIIYVDAPGKGSWSAALGTGNLATHAPTTLEDHFRIGSITKTFTGTVILQMVDEDKLQLDDPVSKYRPEVPNGENITIRELLNMTSGLYNYSEDLGFNRTVDEHPDKVWTPKELVTIAFRHKPYFAPGKGYHYSNTNTILLGMIIEQLTGQPLVKEYQQRIFTPLGMAETSLPDKRSAAIPSPYMHGYMYGTNVEDLQVQVLTGKQATEADAEAGTPRDLTNANPSWTWAAGGGISTVHDLQIWAKALATGKLLSPATQRERLSWVSLGDEPNALKYGLAVANFGGFIGHTGTLPGFDVFEGYNTESDATIVVATNLFKAPDGSSPAGTLTKLIIQNLSSPKMPGSGGGGMADAHGSALTGVPVVGAAVPLAALALGVRAAIRRTL